MENNCLLCNLVAHGRLAHSYMKLLEHDQLAHSDVKLVVHHSWKDTQDSLAVVAGNHQYLDKLALHSNSRAVQGNEELDNPAGVDNCNCSLVGLARSGRVGMALRKNLFVSPGL